MKSQPSTAATVVPAETAAAGKPVRNGATKPSQKTAEPSGKLGKVLMLLKRPKGATVSDLVKATGWQAHSVRGAISGAIKKKLKLKVLSVKSGDVRTYRIKG